MSAHFKIVDRNTPMLLPPDLRDWVPEDDMVHFVIEAVEQVPLEHFQVNHRGTGSKQYPPRMLLGLLVYCYAHGIFSSRRIEQATYRDVAVRYLAGNTHPDHDTLCTFRRTNFEAVSSAFLSILRLARELGFLKVGTVSVDGTHVKANASKYRSVRYDRAGEIEQTLGLEVEELMKQAEAADNTTTPDGQRLPDEIKRRENLREKLAEARKRLEERAQKQGEREQAEYDRKLKANQERGGGGRKPRPPKSAPEPEEQINLTDEDSRLMRKSSRMESTQSYNAQCAVDADGSMLIMSSHVSQSSGDSGELVKAVKGIPAEIGTPGVVLADTGYVNREEFKPLMDEGIDLYIPPNDGSPRRRRHDFRAKKKSRKKKRPVHVKDPLLVAMREKLNTAQGKALYKKRKETVEPVFGIIKETMGFREFHLRGHRKVEGEWSLICLAYNMKRLFKMMNATG